MDISSTYGFVLLITCCLFGLINAYGNGRVESACSTMLPQHGANAQTSTAPYTLVLSKTTYSANEQITVTLKGSSQFEGVFMQARSGSSATPLGTFTVTGSDLQTLTCTSAASAVSHTSSNLKSSVTTTWVAPNINSDVQIRATVVQSEKVFWTNVLSCTLTYNATSASGTGTSCSSPGNNSVQFSASILVVTLLATMLTWLLRQ
ncbi:putative ferric-chelate reductase 1 [Hyperolius riggenbachi]|uniref:putative ferric-chelate reductase 1 n=1 Tax=Hyperolius riggenbachi TaxID=752182 RepID=UPI0035A3B484